MNICVDVGNTLVKIGFFDNDKLVSKISFMSSTKSSSDEFIGVILEQIKVRDIKIHSTNYLIYSSVVPSINNYLLGALKEIFKPIEIYDLSKKLKTGVAMKVDNPSEVGGDLIADIAGVKKLYDAPCLVVDLGTASKILLLDKDGYFSSATIMPGLEITAKSLFENGEMLPNIALTIPTHVIGRNTIDCMNVGIVLGHIEAIKGLVNRYFKELGYETKVILTGGASRLLKEEMKDYIYEESLSLHGLNSILNKNRG